MALVPSTPLIVHGPDDSSTLQPSTLTVSGLPANAVLVTGEGGTVTASNVTPTELSYLSGVTGNVQAQIGNISVSGLSPNVVLVSNATGSLTASNVSTTELGHVRGVTSNIQAQLDAMGGTTFVGTPYDWVTNGPVTTNTPLSFTPLPQRTYLVNAELGIIAPSNDHTVSFGLQWPSPLHSSNAGVVTTAYQESLTTSVVKRASAYTSNPAWSFSTATLANTLIMASLSTVFTTGNTAQISPFSIVANTSNIDRYVYVVYGSHLTYTSFLNTPNFLPVISTVLQPVYTLANNGAPTVISLAATDPEGSPITWSYELVSGTIGNTAVVTQTGNVFTITPSDDEADAGTFTLRFGASDGAHTAYTTNAVFSLNSTAPIITTILSPSYTFATNGTPLVLTLEAYDPEESEITWSYQLVSGSIGSIATIVQDANIFTLTPSTSEANRGTFVLRFAVSDGVNTAYTPSVSFTLPSAPPVITSSLNPSYTLSTTGVTIGITVSATDDWAAALTYSYQVMSGATGNIATVSQSSNTFTIAPSLGETYSGSFTLRFGVSDGINPTVYTSNATFTKPSTAPSITSSLNSTYSLSTVGEPTVITVLATDAEGTPLTYAYELLSGSLTGVATIVQDVNAFTITPGAFNGSFQLRFSVTDGTNTVYTNGATFGLLFPGGQEFAYPGTYTWMAPAGVTSISVVAVGGGGGGAHTQPAPGGGGGGLGWKNNIPITPGSSYTIVVGAGGAGGNNSSGSNGQASYFVNTSTVAGYGGGGGMRYSNGSHSYGGVGGAYVGDGGGKGGYGGSILWPDGAAGGGGAGGYAGMGGTGQSHDGGPGSGIPPAYSDYVVDGVGGAASGGSFEDNSVAGSGGGVGVYGQGANGLFLGQFVPKTGGDGGGYDGQGGSGGANGTGKNTSGGSAYSGGAYGGGGGGAHNYNSYGSIRGGHGAVRIVWGVGRSFPTANVSQAEPTITSSLNSSYALATNGTATTITITATGPSTPITYGYEITAGSLGSTASISQTNNVFTITPSTNTAHAGLFALQFFARNTSNHTAYTASATFSLVFPAGVLYQSPGTYTWTAPAGVTSVCAVCVGGGGGGGGGPYVQNSAAPAGGGGGGLGWRNAIAVTPGQSYTVVVGAGGQGSYANDAYAPSGGTSYFINTGTVAGYGGGGGQGNRSVYDGYSTVTGGSGGSYTGQGGGGGGYGGGVGAGYNSGSGGGAGAGGYSGTGGHGQPYGGTFYGNPPGSGGAGGGGYYESNMGNGYSGGGVGVYGEGASGSSEYYGGSAQADRNGTGGSGGTRGTTSQGGAYGGGGGGRGGTSGLSGGNGAVRIIWGNNGRAFPTTNVSLASSTNGETTV